MLLTGELTPGTMSNSGSGNFLLVPIPEYPLLDCVPNKTVKIVVLGASNVGKTGMEDLVYVHALESLKRNYVSPRVVCVCCTLEAAV